VGAATVLPARIPCALIVAEVLELASQREAKGRRGGREVASVQKRAAHLHLDYQRHTRGPTQRDRAATNKNWMASLPRPPWYSERHRREVPRAPPLPLRLRPLPRQPGYSKRHRRREGLEASHGAYRKNLSPTAQPSCPVHLPSRQRPAPPRAGCGRPRRQGQRAAAGGQRR
jgi:hypothetical protein